MLRNTGQRAKAVNNWRNWRTYYKSPRMRQIEDLVLISGYPYSAGASKLDRLVETINGMVDRAQSIQTKRNRGPKFKPRRIDVGRFWLYPTSRGFFRIRKGRKPPPTLRQVEWTLAS